MHRPSDGVYNGGALISKVISVVKGSPQDIDCNNRPPPEWLPYCEGISDEANGNANTNTRAATTPEQTAPGLPQAPPSLEAQNTPPQERNGWPPEAKALVMEADQREWRKIPPPETECIVSRLSGKGIQSVDDLVRKGIFPKDSIIKTYRLVCAGADGSVPPSSIWGFGAPNPLPDVGPNFTSPIYEKQRQAYESFQQELKIREAQYISTRSLCPLWNSSVKRDILGFKPGMTLFEIVRLTNRGASSDRSKPACNGPTVSMVSRTIECRTGVEPPSVEGFVFSFTLYTTPQLLTDVIYNFPAGGNSFKALAESVAQQYGLEFPKSSAPMGNLYKYLCFPPSPWGLQSPCIQMSLEDEAYLQLWQGPGMEMTLHLAPPRWITDLDNQRYETLQKSVQRRKF